MQKFKNEAIDLGEEIKPYIIKHRFAKVDHAKSAQLNLTLKDIDFKS